MKRELMRPEDDATTYIKFNYWDGGRKGLLSGEALYLDLKRMEMAYHENNKREYELTKHVSLLQLSPLALLQLRTTGRCTVSLPEELFDMDGPGHYFRRIKTVAISIPCVAGPYTSINCTLTMLKSSIRTKPLIGDDYKRSGSEDDCFNDSFGSLQTIVTSTGQNDSGLFETNLRDERYLPFENAGVISEWQLQLPANPSKGEPCQFDYDTISDAILHIRYTSREAGGSLKSGAIDNLKTKIEASGIAGSVRLFSIRHEFPTEWAKFKSIQLGAVVTVAELTLLLREEQYPFWSKDNLDVSELAFQISMWI
jgi:Tc toxin complex TcA C-terminal TcB-binding domain